MVPTNGIGSTGIFVSAVFACYFFRESVELWWHTNKYLLFVVTGYLVFLICMSFEYKQSSHSAWGVLRGFILGSFLAVIVLREISKDILRRSIYIVLVVMLSLLSVVVVFNIQKYGLYGVIERQWIDTTVHRNRLGVGIAISFVMTVALVPVDYKNHKNLCFLIISLLFLSVIGFINHSRGALFAMFGAGGAILLYWNWQRALVSIIGVICLFKWLQSQQISILTHTNSTLGNGRELLWPPIWQRVQENPILGYGLHAVNNDPILQAQKIEAVGHVHSIYLDVIYASGLLGVVVWFFVFLTMFIKNTPIIPKTNNNLLKYIGVGLFSYLAIHGLVDYEFYSMFVIMYLLFAVMLIIPILRKNHENTACR